MKRFVFECYDTLDCDRISYKSMFKFMQVVSRRQPGVSQNPTDILPLNKVEKDVFLEVFQNDFIKIMATLDLKCKSRAKYSESFTNLAK